MYFKVHVLQNEEQRHKKDWGCFILIAKGRCPLNPTLFFACPKKRGKKGHFWAKCLNAFDACVKLYPSFTGGKATATPNELFGFI